MDPRTLEPYRQRLLALQEQLVQCILTWKTPCWLWTRIVTSNAPIVSRRKGRP
jgi:hypothetical protein